MNPAAKWVAVACVLVGAFSVRAAAQGAAPAATAPGRCATPSPFVDPLNGAMWNGWGVGPTNTRFQPASQAGLTAEQVPRLRLKWSFGFAGSTSGYSQPTVAGGRVFVGSQSGAVYSLDAKTGCTYWTFNAQSAVRTGISLGTRKTASGADAYTLYFGDLGARAYALDAATGDLLWARKLDDHPGARITGTPTLYQGRLYVPIASLEEALARSPRYQCCTFRGSLVAVDAETGAVSWKTYTISEEPKAIGKTPAGSRFGPSGVGIWSSPTIDAKRRVVYVATGNNYTEPQQKTADAVMAFDLATGKVKWASQMTPKDVFVVGCNTPNPNCPPAADLGPDFDFGNAPMLATLAGRDMIVLGQKSGIGWALDPDKQGAVMWQYRAGKGSSLGGMEWGSAVDGERVYFPNADPRETAPGGLHAVRLDTGDRVWFAPPPALMCAAGPGCLAAQSAAITVIPGVVFSGAFDGGVRGYSTRDGAVIWAFDTNRDFETVNGVKAKGGSIGGASGAAVVNGMVYVTSGYDGPGGRAGNVLLAFGVD